MTEYIGPITEFEMEPFTGYRPRREAIDLRQIARIEDPGPASIATAEGMGWEHSVYAVTKTGMLLHLRVSFDDLLTMWRAAVKGEK